MRSAVYEESSPTQSSSLLCTPTPFCCHSVQSSLSLLQYPNEKKLVGKSWTESYINLQASHGTAHGESKRDREGERRLRKKEKTLKESKNKTNLERSSPYSLWFPIEGIHWCHFPTRTYLLSWTEQQDIQLQARETTKWGVKQANVEDALNQQRSEPKKKSSKDTMSIPEPATVRT